MATTKDKIAKAIETVRSVSQTHAGVLVVEDDPDLQWRLARMLTARGNRVVGASTGEGALVLMAEWPMDLVLVDDELPGMSGVEVARRIRADYPTVPVILMTGGEPAAVETEAAGAAIGCVSKPLEFEALRDLIETLAGATMLESAE